MAKKDTQKQIFKSSPVVAGNSQNKNFEPSGNFCTIISQHVGRTSFREHRFLDQIQGADEVLKAMKEAETSFDSMMQIRKELEDAYKNLLPIR